MNHSSPALLEHILETLRESLLVLNASMEVVAANPAFYRTFGVSEDETLGRDLYKLGNGQWDNSDLRRLFEQVIPDNTIVNDFEITHDFPRLGRKTMLMNARRIHQEEIVESLILLAIVDITEQKQARDRISLYATRLQQSNRELQNFALIASHDLQEPLRKIQAFTDLLKDEYQDLLKGDGLFYLTELKSSATRMRNLINDLLTLSRLSTRSATFTTVSLNEIVQDVLRDMETVIEEKGASIHVQDLPRIEADPTQMRQLFQNLIGNGLKFSREGITSSVCINVRIYDLPEMDGPSASIPSEARCEIMVEDNGIGFEEEYLDRIFEPFQRLHGRELYEGTGMGLAICKKIVERHGGSITAHSVLAQGSKFIICLPLRQPKERL